MKPKTKDSHFKHDTQEQEFRVKDSRNTISQTNSAPESKSKTRGKTIKYNLNYEFIFKGKRPEQIWDMAFQQGQKQERERCLEIIDKIYSEGCGNEYLDENGDFELICGKHIWKSKVEIEELRLCEECIDKRERLKSKIKEQEE